MYLGARQKCNQFVGGHVADKILKYLAAVDSERVRNARHFKHVGKVFHFRVGQQRHVDIFEFAAFNGRAERSFQRVTRAASF